MALFDGADSLEARSAFVKRYFAYPNTLDPMTPVYRKGLIPVGIFAMMSSISVFALICFITYRLISWRRHYKQYVGYNQYVILIYNLLLADLQQSIAFTITFHWLKLEKIVAPTVPCFLQGWFLHIGDVASGFFVLVIAVHTWLGVVKGYRMSYKWFVVTIVGTWMAALFLTVLGPIMHGDHFFTRAGGWCWVSVDFEPERLWLHYIWIFIVEFGTVGIYAHIFFHLRRSIRSIIHNDTSKLTRATKFMIMYPATYVILTMPLAIGRMVTMAGVQMPDMFFCIAGSFLVSSGWVDALLYTLTRRIFVGSDISSHGQYNRTVTTTTNNAARPGDDYGLQSMHKEMGGRTVTITGGGHRISRLVDSKSRRSQHRRGNPDLLSETSLTGSQDSIVKPGPNAIGIITETNIHVESAESSDGDMSPRSPRPAVTRNNSHSGYSTHSR